MDLNFPFRICMVVLEHEHAHIFIYSNRFTHTFIFYVYNYQNTFAAMLFWLYGLFGFVFIGTTIVLNVFYVIFWLFINYFSLKIKHTHHRIHSKPTRMVLCGVIFAIIRWCLCLLWIERKQSIYTWAARSQHTNWVHFQCVAVVHEQRKTCDWFSLWDFVRFYHLRVVWVCTQCEIAHCVRHASSKYGCYSPYLVVCVSIFNAFENKTKHTATKWLGNKVWQEVINDSYQHRPT